MSQEHVADPAPASLPSAAEPVQSYTFGPFRIDVGARHLLRDEAVIPLPAKVFDTLLVLVKHHERAVGKDELVHAVWPNSFVTDDSLVQNISAIRRALGDDSSQPQFVATLARRGYRFVAPVEEHTEKIASPRAAAEEAGHPKRPAASTLSASPTSHSALLWIAAGFIAGLVVSTIVLVFMWAPTRAPRTAEAPMRFRETVPPGQVLVGGAVLSADSHALVFVARDDVGVAHLWVRALDTGAARPVSGTDGAAEPFWSPDSQFIGFFADGLLKRVGVTAGSPRIVVARQRLRALGGTWGPGDLVLYADQGKILSVSASGGTPAIVVEPDPTAQQGEFRWPHFLPDGRHFLFFASGENPDQSGTYLGTLGSRATVRLLGGSNSPAIYAPPGYLLYLRERVLMAQRFDLARGQLQGDPMTVAGDVSESTALSATAGGLLAVSEETSRERLVWFSRGGKELGTVNVPRVLRNLALSPNNKQLLASSLEHGNLVVWLIDLDRDVSTQIAANGSFPAWAPDGVHFAFSSVRNGEGDLFVKSIMGGTEELALKTDEVKVVNDWSSDGRFIVFTNNIRRDLWLLPTFGDRKPVPFLHTGGRARNGKVSPDGQRIAYLSDETGQMEVYVQSFPAPGAKRRVSTSGGAQPVWRQDGRELFYLSDRQVMAVTIPTGEGLEPGKPQPLFLVPNLPSQFSVTRDGQRFLVTARDPASNQGSITILTNWEAAQRP